MNRLSTRHVVALVVASSVIWLPAGVRSAAGRTWFDRTVHRVEARVQRRAAAPLGGRKQRVRKMLNHYLSDTNPTMNYPYFWAWKTFAEVNGPSARLRTDDGTTKRFPEWETWASDVETFPSCPSATSPPTWPGGRYRTKRLVKARNRFISSEGTKAIDWYELQDGVPVATSVDDPQEVRRNRPSFDYIVDNGLYYTEGLAAAFARAQSGVDAVGGNPARSIQAVLDVVDFPKDAIEIKADWVPIADIPEAQRDQFYRNVAVTTNHGTESTAEYALVAMHISTKQVPFWFWATWMNVNVLGRCDYTGCRDDFGLVGGYTSPNTDANYPYSDGGPTKDLIALLDANTITEQGGLQTGSCITCHARAAVTSTGATLSVVSSTASAETPPPGDTGASDNGTPDPTWFWTWNEPQGYFDSNTTITGVTAVQLDFVWGILNANSVSACSSSVPMAAHLLR
jgi:hypothetical protein